MRRRFTAVGVALAVILFANLVLFAFAMTAKAHHTKRVSACAEDEMLAGAGNFRHGKWTRYVCVHPDDVTAETIENDWTNPAVYATVKGSVCDHPRFWYRQTGISIMPEACDGEGY